MTHYWPASHLLLSIAVLRSPPRRDELSQMRHRWSLCVSYLLAYSRGTCIHSIHLTVGTAIASLVGFPQTCMCALWCKDLQNVTIYNEIQM